MYGKGVLPGAAPTPVRNPLPKETRHIWLSPYPCLTVLGVTLRWLHGKAFFSAPRPRLHDEPPILSLILMSQEIREKIERKISASFYFNNSVFLTCHVVTMKFFTASVALSLPSGLSLSSNHSLYARPLHSPSQHPTPPPSEPLSPCLSCLGHTSRTPSTHAPVSSSSKRDYRKCWSLLVLTPVSHTQPCFASASFTPRAAMNPKYIFRVAYCLPSVHQWGL